MHFIVIEKLGLAGEVSGGIVPPAPDLPVLLVEAGRVAVPGDAVFVADPADAVAPVIVFVDGFVFPGYLAKGIALFVIPGGVGDLAILVPGGPSLGLVVVAVVAAAFLP